MTRCCSDFLVGDGSAAAAAAEGDMAAACEITIAALAAMLPPRTAAAAAAVALATCGIVALLLAAAQTSYALDSSNSAFNLCHRALELLRDVDAKYSTPLHVHAQVILFYIASKVCENKENLMLALLLILPLLLLLLQSEISFLSSDLW
jgi:hypothetical protein